jgi:hypothetical protein
MAEFTPFVSFRRTHDSRFVIVGLPISATHSVRGDLAVGNEVVDGVLEFLDTVGERASM